MRIVGVLLFILGAVATAYAIDGVDRRGRPLDVAFAIAAPIAAIAALVGLILAFVPGFFG